MGKDVVHVLLCQGHVISQFVGERTFMSAPLVFLQNDGDSFCERLHDGYLLFIK